MKLSLKWFRTRFFAASTCVALMAICESNLLAAPIDSDVLDGVGLTVEFTAADPDHMPAPALASAGIVAEANGLANDFGILATEKTIKSIEGGSITSTDETGASVKALIARSALDGELVVTTTDDVTYRIPTKTGAERVSGMYGLVFGDNQGAKPVTLSVVTGAGAQSGLQQGETVAEVNGTAPESALHAAALFFNAIKSSGRATIKIGTTQFEVPQSPIVTGVGRGVSSGTGPQVPFPQFLGRGTLPRQEKSVDRSSSNEVITARVETYYFRDAHRLAQILNRGVRSYQAAAVSQLERAAEDARGNFELAKSRRRDAEFQAEQKAKLLRQKKEELRNLVNAFRSRLDGGTQSKTELENALAALLAQHNAKLEEQQMLRDQDKPQLDAMIASLRVQLASANDTTDPTDEEIEASINQKEAERDSIDTQLMSIEQSLKDLNTSIATQKQLILDLRPQTDGSDTQTANSETLKSLVDEVKSLETEVANATLQARQANEAEELAAKDQFRAEVSAAKADPDTYVAGDMDSVDPVTQVSISVIGEGVLHLRGPRLGVVKLRDMIHQIDHPVGQVKIGIMTVQLNGEQGARMENTLRRMEGHLSRGRFLTYVSEQLFKRAVAETAARIAGEAKAMFPSDPRLGIAEDTYQFNQNDATRLQRWHAYVSAFFGHDFLEGLKDVDRNTPVLNPLNKLLSLNSADSLSLAEALFVTGLAKAEVRQEIQATFRHHLCCDLPERDIQWIKVNRIKKGWDPRWWGEDCTDPDNIRQHAQEFYTFTATDAYFERDYVDSDALNPFQRELIRLVQGLATERWLHEQRIDLIQKRQLISVGSGTKLTKAQEFLVSSEIDRMTEAHLNAQDAIRGHKAAMDRLIKQVVIAMEDDCYAQFYGPAMERIRRATTEWDVELGSVEQSTILTNNRAFGKVAPQATYQFDLPKRDILLAEAMQAAYALHQDLGPLVGDPNFATLTKMFSQQSISGSTVDGTIKSVLPGLDSTTDQKNLLYADSTQPQKFGTELEKLIPDPAIYKFETGTGFQVRPVVQPDGQSVVFDFDYMYTTDLLEPTSPDERSLGRVKRHFVNSEVQIGNLEWREISRYEISLKAARNSRGVPLLEDIPAVGVLFRPLPQAKKSIQKNIIIGQAAVYPTVEDLLGLKSPAAAGLPVDQLSTGLEILQRKHQKTSDDVNALLQSRAEEALGVRQGALSAGSPASGSERLALPAPIRRLSYESGESNGRNRRSHSVNPAKPQGSVPARVTSPRPTNR